MSNSSNQLGKSTFLKRPLGLEHTESLWNQCLFAVLDICQKDGKKALSIEEIDRLVLLASKQITGDFHKIIRDIVSDSINDFEDIPF